MRPFFGWPLVLVPVAAIGCSSGGGASETAAGGANGQDAGLGDVSLPEASTPDTAHSDTSAVESSLPDSPPDTAVDRPAETASPLRPPDDFLTPTSPNYLEIEYKGIINSEKTIREDTANAIQGTGHLQAHYGEMTFELTTSDELYSYEYFWGRWLKGHQSPRKARLQRHIGWKNSVPVGNAAHS